MKVSVPLLAYNHEQYLRQAIDSVLMQQVDFNYEVIIGEDGSTDDTVRIALDYERKHPDKVRVLLQNRETAERHRQAGLGGKMNFITTLQACRGEYVALLDGDDYWTDPLKLRQQVAFMDTHPSCTICFHDILILSQGDNGTELQSYKPPKDKQIFTIEDLLEGNFIHSCSVLFRNHLLKDFPEWYLTSPVGDWPLYIMLARQGDVGYLNRPMATYRLHRAAFWSSKGELQQLSDGIDLLYHLNSYLDHRYDRRMKSTQCKYLERMSDLKAEQGDREGAKNLLADSLKLKLSTFRPPSRSLIVRWTKLTAPAVYNVLRSVLNTVYFKRS